MALVYQEYLKHEPYRVSHIDTGKVALQVIVEQAPDAVILDLKLVVLRREYLRHAEAKGSTVFEAARVLIIPSNEIAPYLYHLRSPSHHI